MGHPLVEAVEVGHGALVNVRWSDAALTEVATEAAARRPVFEAPPPCRACRRAEDFLRMAAREHGSSVLVQAPHSFDETRAILSRIEAALATPRSDARHRLMDDVARRVDALYVRFPLLRGAGDLLAERAVAMTAAAAAMRWAAGEGWQPSRPSAPLPW